MNLHLNISDWIRKKVLAAGAKGCVLGLSGGLDSSVVALLCKKVFPKDTLALIIPCHSHKIDLEQAKEFAKKFGLMTREIDLTVILETLYIALEGKTYEDQQNLCCANLKPRLRMAALYYYANKLNYLVVGTGNKSELKMGYFTKYGDGGVDLLPLGDLLKTEVRELAKGLGVPQEIIEKVPSAGLWPGQTDESEMGITYEELDRIIGGKLEGVSREKIELARKKSALSEHKRHMPESYKRG